MVIRTEADAEAAKMISEALTRSGPGLIPIRKIEAAQYMAEKLAQNPNISFLQNGNTMNMLNLNPK